MRVNKMTISEINAQYGKIPPQAIELEEAVLGALMLERDSYLVIAEIIGTESFYKEEHQKIFNVIKYLSDNGKPIDLLIVTRELMNRGDLEMIGGPMTITELTSRVASAAHIEFHARIIAQKFMQRELIRICSEVQTKAYDDTIDVDDIMSFLDSQILSMRGCASSQNLSIKNGIEDIKKMMLKNIDSQDSSGLKTGLDYFDRFSGGLQKTDLVIIAGDSSQGKTSLALTIAKNATLNHGAITAMYSLEMSKMQLISRLISQETGISSKRIINYTIKKDELDKIDEASAKLSNMNMYFDEKSTSSISNICSSLRNLKLKYNINLAIIDYLQLVNSDLKGKTDESQIADITRRLKNVAKDLDICIIALSQFSRPTNGNIKPSKGRLRGSGQIEEAADIVMTVWRPETFNIPTIKIANEDVKSAGIAECRIEKGRNIGTCSFFLRFNKETTGFYNY